MCSAATRWEIIAEDWEKKKRRRGMEGGGGGEGR